MGSIMLRALMIGGGGVAIKYFRPVLLGCSVLLVVSSVQMIFCAGDDDDDDDLADNRVVKLAKWCTPVSGEYDGDKFFTRGEHGCVATPLLLVMVTIEFSDVAFAVDSVPAIFGVTDNATVVWSACMCAIFCLRSLYSLIVDVVSDLECMDKGIGIVLMFVAGKIVADVCFNVQVPIWCTLAIVGGILGLATLASICIKKRNQEIKVSDWAEDGANEEAPFLSNMDSDDDLDDDSFV